MPAPHAENAIYDAANASEGSTVTYTCLKGHVTGAQNSLFNITCLNGVWKGSTENCEGNFLFLCRCHNILLLVSVKN